MTASTFGGRRRVGVYTAFTGNGSGWCSSSRMGTRRPLRIAGPTMMSERRITPSPSSASSYMVSALLTVIFPLTATDRRPFGTSERPFRLTGNTRKREAVVARQVLRFARHTMFSRYAGAAEITRSSSPTRRAPRLTSPRGPTRIARSIPASTRSIGYSVMTKSSVISG